MRADPGRGAGLRIERDLAARHHLPLLPAAGGMSGSIPNGEVGWCTRAPTSGRADPTPHPVLGRLQLI